MKNGDETKHTWSENKITIMAYLISITGTIIFVFIYVLLENSLGYEHPNGIIIFLIGFAVGFISFLIIEYLLKRKYGIYKIKEPDK